MLDASAQYSIQVIEIVGVPYRIRTGVAAVRGRCPGPLDEGDEGRRLDTGWRRSDQASPGNLPIVRSPDSRRKRGPEPRIVSLAWRLPAKACIPRNIQRISSAGGI